MARGGEVPCQVYLLCGVGETSNCTEGVSRMVREEERIFIKQWTCRYVLGRPSVFG